MNSNHDGTAEKMGTLLLYIISISILLFSYVKQVTVILGRHIKAKDAECALIPSHPGSWISFSSAQLARLCSSPCYDISRPLFLQI